MVFSEKFKKVDFVTAQVRYVDCGSILESVSIRREIEPVPNRGTRRRFTEWELIGTLSVTDDHGYYYKPLKNEIKERLESLI